MVTRGDMFDPYGYEDLGLALLYCEIDVGISVQPRDFENIVGRSRRGRRSILSGWTAARPGGMGGCYETYG